MTETEAPILLFDGVCNLCSSSVQFVLRHNAKGNIRFASLQSEFGQRTLKRYHLPSEYIDSLVLLENGKAYVKSDAALKLSKHLNGPWKFGSVLLVIPVFIRNAVYDLIARYRYSWFGRKEVCWMPQPEWKNRFLDQ